MLNLTGEESNYEVLKRVQEQLCNFSIATALDRNIEVGLQTIQAELDEFFESKRQLVDDLDEITIKARKGDNNAAKELISKLALLKDGP